MKCSNCASDALYGYKVTADFVIHYCEKHLPKFLLSQKAAGLLKIDVPAPVVPTPSKKKTDPVVTDTPAEEAPAEDANNS
jgi:hypothetical protein